MLLFIIMLKWFIKKQSLIFESLPRLTVRIFNCYLLAVKPSIESSPKGRKERSRHDNFRDNYMNRDHFMNNCCCDVLSIIIIIISSVLKIIISHLVHLIIMGHILLAMI